MTLSPVQLVVNWPSLGMYMVAGNTVSAIVFWPTSNETLTATSFLLICLAIIDNVMLFLYYLLIGVYETCSFHDTCHYYRKVGRPD